MYNQYFTFTYFAEICYCALFFKMFHNSDIDISLISQELKADKIVQILKYIKFDVNLEPT
jgi:hypothetical protein